MLETKELLAYLNTRFDSLEKTIERIGSITDSNANSVSGLVKTCEYLEKSIESQKIISQKHDVDNQADFDRLYDRVSKRVKISTLYWVVGIAVTIMGVLSPIVAELIRSK